MDAATADRTYTDEQLDRDWQPSSRRPLSTVARSFSDELMDIFRIDNSVADLDRQVDNRRAKVNRNTMELASLEARLREMENRLKQSQHARPDLGGGLDTSSPASRHAPPPSHAPSHAPPPPPPAKNDVKSRSRPGTARTPQHAPSAGNMPPTPGGSEDGDRE